jgi:hypothetical protein
MKRLALLALLVAAVASPRAEEVVAPITAPATVPPPRARLAAWRAKARPPADVPATTLVRAAVRKDPKADGERRKPAARTAPNTPAVEIIWHAPGWVP